MHQMRGCEKNDTLIITCNDDGNDKIIERRKKIRYVTKKIYVIFPLYAESVLIRFSKQMLFMYSWMQFYIFFPINYF